MTGQEERNEQVPGHCVIGNLVPNPLGPLTSLVVSLTYISNAMRKRCSIRTR